MPDRTRPHRTITPSIVIVLTLLAILRTSASFAQPPTSTEELPPSPSITSEQIDAELKLVEDSTEMDDAAKTQLKDLLAQAKAALGQSAAEVKRAEVFRAWIATAPDDLIKARSQQDQPAQVFDFGQAESWDLNQLVTNGASLDQRLVEARGQFAEAQAEPSRRSARITEISEEIAAARAELAAVEAEQKSQPSDNGTPAIQRAREFLLDARRQATQATIESLENERTAYEAQGELPRLRSELAGQLVAQLTKDAKHLNDLIADRRRGDAQAQKQEANAIFAAAPDLLKPYAQKSIDRSDQRIERASELQLVTPERTKIADDLQLWRDDFRRTKARVEEGASTTHGIVLLKKQSSMPDVSQCRKAIAKRIRDIRSIQGELLDLEDRRAVLKDVETAAGATIAELRGKGRPLPPNAGDELVRIYQLESRILADLHDDTERYFVRLVEANENQEALANEIEQYNAFINQRVFWIRSTAPLQVDDLSNAAEAFAWLASPGNWQDLADAVTAASRPRARRTLAAVCIGLLLVFRRRIRRKVEELGKIASTRLCRQFAPTLQALPLTLLLAAFLPALFLFAAWTLDASPHEFPMAVSVALTAVAMSLFSGILTLEVCRAGGIAGAHLGWSPRALVVVRTNLRLLLLAGTPLLFLTALFAHQTDPLYRASAGRLCHVTLMMFIAFILHRVFRPKNGVFGDVDGNGSHGWLNRYGSVWHFSLVLIPVGMALLSGLGFYYTARQLSIDYLRSFELLFWLFVAEGILYRSVRVKRRQLRWQQLLDARDRQTSGEEIQKDDLTALAAEEDAVDLGEIDQQTRRLIDSSIVIIGLLGIWSIWADVLPALGFLDKLGLWTVQTADGAAQLVSIGDVLFAILVAVFTFVAAKNIPGLIDIVLLDRLTMESSLRYAVSALCQYAIAIVGALVVCYLVGIRWGNAQWLIAALSVGLGFGLQEVVANFVCGILLLFERPVRVGDTVTLGDTTGVVIRIRSRATTVRNWDRQEVVVPNKELITGRIINWTLSDQWNRIVLTVGIAYGSNTQRACDVLSEILRENPNVLENPEPRVTFEQFGDSTLNFVIRAILSDMNDRIGAIHDLHMQINDRFAQEGIEIAFPQRDLHIRSANPSVDLSADRGTEHRHRVEQDPGD